MAVTKVILKCGHTMDVDLPADNSLRAKMIRNYQQQNCVACRRKEEKAHEEEKELRMAKIKEQCVPMKTEDEKIKQSAEKIRIEKLSILDDMFNKLACLHGFATKEEIAVFSHYRQRTVLRFCRQTDADWWLIRQHRPVEAIIDDLKESTFVVDGRVLHAKTEQDND